MTEAAFLSVSQQLWEIGLILALLLADFFTLKGRIKTLKALNVKQNTGFKQRFVPS